jgi:hypothetical protein
MIVRNIAGGFGQGPLGTLVFPATVNTADPAALTEGLAAQLSVDASGRLRSLITPSSGVVFSVTPAILAQSVGQSARAVAPGAGAVIATIAAGSLPAGTYDVQAKVMLDVGAPAAADANNMEFRRGAAVISALQVLLVIGVYAPLVIFRMVMDGATALSINATGAATAGVGYNAELLATRIA